MQTKAEFIKAVAEHFGITLSDSERLLAGLAQVVTKGLSTGAQRIRIPDICDLKVVTLDERGRKRRVVHIKPAPAVSEAV